MNSFEFDCKNMFEALPSVLDKDNSTTESNPIASNSQNITSSKSCEAISENFSETFDFYSKPAKEGKFLKSQKTSECCESVGEPSHHRQKMDVFCQRTRNSLLVRLQNSLADLKEDQIHSLFHARLLTPSVADFLLQNIFFETPRPSIDLLARELSSNSREDSSKLISFLLTRFSNQKEVEFPRPLPISNDQTISSKIFSLTDTKDEEFCFESSEFVRAFQKTKNGILKWTSSDSYENSNNSNSSQYHQNSEVILNQNEQNSSEQIPNREKDPSEYYHFRKTDLRLVSERLEKAQEDISSKISTTLSKAISKAIEEPCEQNIDFDSSNLESLLNQTRSKFVPPADYLDMMKRYEKANYFDPEQKPEKIFCQVCSGQESPSDNPVIECERCLLQAHKKCIGLDNLNAEEYICDLCRRFGDAASSVSCALCTMKGRAMKEFWSDLTVSKLASRNKMFFDGGNWTINSIPKEGWKDEDSKDTTDENNQELKFWAHLSCILWLPGISMTTKNGSLYIRNLLRLPVSDFAATCEVCMKVGGFVHKCAHNACNSLMHIECGRRNGAFLRVSERIKHEIFCCKHNPTFPSNRLRMNSEVKKEQVVRFIENLLCSNFPKQKLNKSLLNIFCKRDTPDSPFSGNFESINGLSNSKALSKRVKKSTKKDEHDGSLSAKKPNSKKASKSVNQTLRKRQYVKKLSIQKNNKIKKYSIKSKSIRSQDQNVNQIQTENVPIVKMKEGRTCYLCRKPKNIEICGCRLCGKRFHVTCFARISDEEEEGVCKKCAVHEQVINENIEIDQQPSEDFQKEL